MNFRRTLALLLLSTLELLHLDFINSEALQLTQEIYQDTLNKNKLVFINFYADWCHFSQILKPIWDDTAKIIHDEYSDVKFARVDCENQQQIALENAISKYPTLKLFRNGKVLRKEYRGQRSVDAFSSFIKQQLKPSMVDVLKPEDLKIDENRNTFIGYFESKNSDGYQTLGKLADELRETTDFLAVLGDASTKERAVGENIVFKPKKKSGEVETTYTGSHQNFELLKQWAEDRANPLVREITFENGEELTEEGLPFLILFHKPEDVTAIQRYKNGVMRELMEERGRINFLTADGTTFAHPLHHLGKSIDDLPLICIDSFRHMYLFKKFDDVDVPGKLKQFVADLHSGKLHQDFHNPQPDDNDQAQGHHHGQPSQEQQQPETPEKQADTDDGNTDNASPDQQIGDEPEKKSASGSGSGKSPPETVFNKLAPSENRYTLLHWRDYSGNYRDEL
ncbi:endoplasmic reticulum resident protein 44-like isoform X2 [Hydractinia symbiolongicarpus]|uniref:endoplasmic reticulum resident protein 44-like isoform X2 n=1 Tax=Hydractinia symbiolongicarpus TaxID=13093 RepID=UPI00254D93E9|nr:endoplasmic reticulum resident protein 44-like isoform X2 [Hydractinia symbiolongicarpus]